MRQKLQLPAGLDGDLWHYRHHGRANAMHHHAELEFNLVTQGRGLYLLANRKYQIRRGDLLWLFPAQEHVLIEQSSDFEMWIGVAKPKAVRRLATDTNAKVLREANPSGEYCRRLPQPVFARLEALLGEVAATRKHPGFFNAGLGYALLAAWQSFERAADVPVHDVHPAVEKAARHIRDRNNTLHLPDLGEARGFEPGTFEPVVQAANRNCACGFSQPPAHRTVSCDLRRRAADHDAGGGVGGGVWELSAIPSRVQARAGLLAEGISPEIVSLRQSRSISSRKIFLSSQLL